MSKDKRFHDVLAFETQDAVSGTSGRECLVEFATYYGVIRTLRVTAEAFRLQGAYEALCATRIPRGADVVEMVCEFARALGDRYGALPLSAASKFLWVRFRSPVVVYDMLVSDGLHLRYGYKYDGYPNYYKIWTTSYRENEERIREACNELNAIKKFTLASEVPQKDLSELISRQWFMERVFDHAMQMPPISG